jgi:hypothetical protein
MTDSVKIQATAQARTPGAKRAEPGEYYFDMTKVNSIMGGPNYSSVFGGCVEGERMIAADADAGGYGGRAALASE